MTARPRKKDRLRVVVIGAGLIGQDHLRKMAALSEFELRAAADLDKMKLEAARLAFGLPKTYADWRLALARERPDLVVVALPNFLHAEATIAALESGAHVLCEKPPAITSADARRMMKAALRAKRQLTYHLNVYRFSPSGVFLRRWAEEGSFGGIYFARTGWRRRDFIPGWGEWFLRKSQAGGGPMLDIGVHRLDYALWVMGYPKALSVSGVAFHHQARRHAEVTGRAMDVEDFACGLIRLEGGAAIEIEASWRGHEEHEELTYSEFWGTESGAIHRGVRDAGGYREESKVFLEKCGHRAELRHIEAKATAPGFHAEFARAIREGGAPPVEPAQGVALVEILEALYASAETGREAAIGDGGRARPVSPIKSKPAKTI